MSILKRGRPRKKEPPAGPGVYRIVNKETGKIDKIGETNNLKRRKSEHFNSSNK